ncbi:hypothetical protein [Erythrobacter sp.]|uniref:hypothetical protein n=1 Tax=Erythrobacter sp. TaxID=1042 RepID=UPI002600E93E|nr:hypothetical protein [Erythrobacter sp.]
MTVLGWILLACLILTALRWAVLLIAAVLMIGLAVSLVRAPGQTLSVLFGVILLNAFAAHPGLGLILFILIVLAGRLGRK